MGETSTDCSYKPKLAELVRKNEYLRFSYCDHSIFLQLLFSTTFSSSKYFLFLHFFIIFPIHTQTSPSVTLLLDNLSTEKMIHRTNVTEGVVWVRRGKIMGKKCKKRKYLELEKVVERGSWRETEWSQYENLKYSFFLTNSANFGL